MKFYCENTTKHNHCIRKEYKKREKRKSINQALLVIISTFILISVFSTQITLSFQTKLELAKAPQQSSSPWCWTEPKNTDPMFRLDAKNGGLNWGFLPQGNSQASKVNYSIELQTSKREKSGTNSKLFIKLYGTQGASDYKLISDSIIEVGSIKSMTFSNKDLGQLYQVSLFIKGQQCYRPYKIKVFSGFGTEYSFESLKGICPCSVGGDPTRCQVELKEEGNFSYEVEVKTKDFDGAGRQGPIHIILIGTNGMSNEKIFNEMGAERGSSSTELIKSGDLGEITGFRFKIPTRGSWEPSLVNIVNSISGDRKTFPLEKSKLLNPGKEMFDFNFVPINPKSASEAGSGDMNIFGDDSDEPYNSFYHSTTPSGGGNYGDKTADEFDKQIRLNQNSNFGTDGRTAVGALTSPEEKRRMINLTCNQKLLNPSEENQIFGPDFAGGNVNFFSILARCPHNCDKYTDPVYGVGEHPDITPICLAAMIDKAMPAYGGILAINVFPALTKYAIPTGFTKIGNIGLKSYYERSGKTFTLAKVDNVDMVEKDIRILDNKGNITNEGRVEFRIDGYWGTLCFRGVNEQAAIRICKDLDFNYGFWKNPTDGANNEYCRNHKGEDYCGSMYLKSFFRDFTCDQRDKSINECHKIGPVNQTECNHSFDAIISCTNDDIQSNTANNAFEATNGTVRLISNRKINGEEIGRMEVYQKQKWGSVCDIGFSDDSALIACRQMSYDSGRWYNNDNAKEWKLPSKPGGGIYTASKIECSGQENNIGECEYIKENIQCEPQRDVVLACRGEAGDPSGNKQIKPPVVTPAPDLGKLGMVYSRITCETTGLDYSFRGDPGSVFIVECPPGCEKRPGTVVGTAVYSGDSNICKSACHAGVFSCENGGEAVLVKTFGQKNFDATRSHDIESTKRLMEFPIGFTFTKKWSNYVNYKNLLENNNLATVNHQNMLQKSFFERILDGAADSVSSLMFGNQQERQDYHQNQSVTANANLLVNQESVDGKVPDPNSFGGIGAAITGSLSWLSFLESSQSSGSKFGPVAFKWAESIGTHKFSEYGKIIKRGSPIKSLGTMYTIFLSFMMEEWRNKEAYIFSYSGCGGFNIWLDSRSTLQLGDPCDDRKKLNTGLNVPLKDKCFLYIQYNKKKLIIALKVMKVNGYYVRQNEFSLPIPEKDKLALGCRASDEKNVFVGNIDFIIIYESLIPRGMIKEIVREIEENKKSNDDTVNNNPFTKDGRKCVAAPLTGPTPGQAGSPTPPTKANPFVGPNSPILPPEGQIGGDFIPNVNIDHALPEGMNISLLETKSNGIWDKAKDFLFGKKKPVQKKKNSGSSNGAASDEDASNMGSIRIECEDNAMGKRFNNQQGKIFRIGCGSCSNARYPVFGSKIYHPRSSICRAAIHAGILRPGKKGDIILEIGPEFKAFNGEPGAGRITSLNMGGENFSFQVKEAPPLRIISCTTKGNEGDLAISPKNSKYILVCPKYCSKKKNYVSVYGSGTYSDNSPICMAAFHDGIIGDQGGNVQVMFSDGLSEYKGTQGFTIKSKATGPQLRSFTFLGERSSIFHSYKETCSERINENWEQIDDKNTIYTTENAWNCYNNPEWHNNERLVEPIKTIQHKGRIKNRSSGLNYGTVLKYTNQNAEWSNGLIKVNLMMFGNSGKTAVMFRFQDIDNHFGIVFDLNDKNNNIKLYKKTEGSVEIVKGIYSDINIGIWYRLQIFLDYNNTRITLQTGNVRQHKVIFDTPMKGIQRGTIALGVDYMRRVFFMGVEITKWTPDSLRENNDKNFRCMIDKIQNVISLDKRTSVCRRMFKRRVDEISRCVEPHVFCQLKCDEHISKHEPIANFCCFKTCVQSILNLNKHAAIGDISWIPSINEKVDYIKKGETMFIEAVIKEVKDDVNNDGKIITLSYVYPGGFEEKAEEKWNSTSKNIVKCGQELPSRRDC